MSIDNALEYESPKLIGTVEAHWLRDSIIEALNNDLTDEARECFLVLLTHTDDMLDG